MATQKTKTPLLLQGRRFAIHRQDVSRTASGRCGRESSPLHQAYFCLRMAPSSSTMAVISLMPNAVFFRTMLYK